MSLRRAVGFLLTRRFSPRVIARTAPARSFHTLKELPIGDGLRGAAGVAAVACAGVGAWAAQDFRKGPDDDESAARKKEEEMKVMFENWMKEFNKTYRDEEEKAMRFQVFKDTVKWIESKPPSFQECLLPPNCFADLKREERPCSHSCISLEDEKDQQ